MASLVLAIAASAYLLLAPTAQSETGSVTVGPDGNVIERTESTHSTTLLQDEPGVALAIVAVALLVAGAPLAFNRKPWRAAARTASALALWAGAVLAGLSVGLFYLPAAVAMTIAATRSDRLPAAGSSAPGVPGPVRLP